MLWPQTVVMLAQPSQSHPQLSIREPVRVTESQPQYLVHEGHRTANERRSGSDHHEVIDETGSATGQPPSAVFWEWLAHTVQWGNAQELLTWLVAGAALFFAAKAANAAKNAEIRQNEQIQEIRSDKVREQANRIAAWPTIAQTGSQVVMIRNASDLPVHNFHIVIGGKGWPRYTEVKKVLPPTTSPVILTNDANDQILLRSPSLSIEDYSVSYGFRDAAGRYWIREPNEDVHESDKAALSRWYRSRKAALTEFNTREQRSGENAGNGN